MSSMRMVFQNSYTREYGDKVSELNRGSLVRSDRNSKRNFTGERMLSVRMVDSSAGITVYTTTHQYHIPSNMDNEITLM